MAGLSLTIQAQDITNTLGTSGHYYLNDVNSKSLIDFESSGTNNYYRFKNINDNSTDLDLYNSGGNNRLNFYYARGTADAPTQVQQYNGLGIIEFYGYKTGGTYVSGAKILAEATATPSTQVATRLMFYTSNGTSLTNRMTIDSEGEITNNGSMALSIRTVAAGLTLTATDYTLIISASDSETIALPAVAGCEGRIYVIKQAGSSETITIDPDGTEQIDGQSTATLNASWEYIVIQCTGGTWIIIGGNGYTSP